MYAILASTLFIAAGLLAIAAIAWSWLRYGPAAVALRRELAACTRQREMRYVVVTTQVRRAPVRVQSAAARPQLRPTLRAAA